jgi:hypothetical protein
MYVVHIYVNTSETKKEKKSRTKARHYEMTLL